MNDKASSLEELMAADSQPNADANLPSSEKVTDLTSLVTTHIELEQRLEEAEAVVKKIKAQLLALSTQEIPELFTEMGNIEEFKLSDGTSIKVAPDLAVSIKKGKDDDCFAFLEENNLGPIIKSTFGLAFGKDEQEQIDATRKLLLENDAEFSEKRAVHASTLKSTIKKLTEAGIKIPESFNYFPFKKTVIKRGK